MDTTAIKKYLENQKIKVVESFDFDTRKVKYSEKIKGWKIDKFRGDEEIVRAYIVAKLVNDLGYKPENIELEKEYDIGRPKVNKPRIDIIVRSDDGDAFLYIELKSPSDYEKDKDEVIEKQLYNLASQEKGQGKHVKYLVLFTLDANDTTVNDKCIIIDYDKFGSFDSWKDVRDYADEIPERYGKAQKEVFVKSGKKDLEANFTFEQLEGLRRNLHNVLWGGGSTDDNDIFSSLVNIILAKIQDETEKRVGEKYDFQIFAYKDGDSFETNSELYKRINELYKRALEQRLGITDKEELDESYIIDKKKFSLSKLKYTVSQLESYSFVDGKNSLDGKDILGEFFEGIIREGFKQNKGQFFTHVNVVKFMLWAVQADKLAISCVNGSQQLPYAIDPSAGSGTFLIEYMKFITENIKNRFSTKIDSSYNTANKIQTWFYPDNLENKWAQEYIYGSDLNFNLGTASKVNMVLHGDGSANIYVKDGLLPFSYYSDRLSNSTQDPVYHNKEVNEKFDLIITNPPFSVDLDNDTKKNIQKEFIFGSKKNSENLFIERWYQLLKPKGRVAAVLPESVYDTSENKYIRLFLFKYFNIKATVSMPQLTFEPFTSTKTSLLFAQKKTKEEVNAWNKLWTKYSSEWGELKTRAENLKDVYLNSKDRSKLPSIKTMSISDERIVLLRLLEDTAEESDKKLEPKEIILKYTDEISELCNYDFDTKEVFGFVNTWWVFGRVAKDLDQTIHMSEVDNVGYKRTLRGEKLMPNDLYRVSKDGEIIVDDGIKETALDYLRTLQWD